MLSGFPFQLLVVGNAWRKDFLNRVLSSEFAGSFFSASRIACVLSSESLPTIWVDILGSISARIDSITSLGAFLASAIQSRKSHPRSALPG